MNGKTLQKTRWNRLLTLLACLPITTTLIAQGSFLDFQKGFKNVALAFANKEQLLKEEFKAKKIDWPAKYIYLRSFKWDSKLEVWVKQNRQDPYRLLKTYSICALAGGFGPKRFEGDYQVPEGFYSLNQFRPNSQYHLALGVNYPNVSDKILSDPARPGGEIYIHGSCVTVGCIPITDQQIEELYVLASFAKNAGNDFIPLHIMPIAFRNEKSKESLDKWLETRPDYKPTLNTLERVYHYFNQYKRLPIILVNSRGEYVLAQNYLTQKKVTKQFVANTEKRLAPTKHKTYSTSDFFTFVHSPPKFPGGLDAFSLFIQQTGDELAQFVPDNAPRRLYVSVEFVVDKDGQVINVKPSALANNEMNNYIIQKFETMPNWQPALRNDAPVPFKLVQNLIINAKPVILKKQTEEEAYD